MHLQRRMPQKSLKTAECESGMKTVYYTLTGGNEDAEAIRLGGNILREGGLVAFPTETVYGLGASALSVDAASKIYEAKGRPSDNPLIVHVAAPEEAETFAYTSDTYYRIAEKFMPGPITVILPKRDVVPTAVTGGLNTVAVRCPVNETARGLIREAGVPIAAPSANRSGKPSPTSGEHVKRDMDGRVDMIIDGGECAIGVESTVVTLDGENCRILRPGAVTEDMLAEVCTFVEIDPAVADVTAVGDNPSSPGMKYRHYAPAAKVMLIESDTEEQFISYVNENGTAGDGVFASAENKIRFKPEIEPLETGEKGTFNELNHNLYRLLRLADDKCLKRIYIRRPPKRGEFLALFNRLIRAASGEVIKL